MRTKNMKALLSATAVAAALVACFGLAACGSSTASSSAAASNASASASSPAASTAASSTSASAASTSAAASSAAASSAASAAAAPGEAAGFTEIPIFEDEIVDFLHVNAVYFQPVPMTDGNGVEGYDLHLEADISAEENDYGFEVGGWVPYLTVDYKVIGSDGNTAAEGTFMEMSASDGPHYGANIALPNADTYTLEITIHSPADNNYLLHTDAETGPGAKSFDETKWPLVVTYEGWDYTPQEW